MKADGELSLAAAARALDVSEDFVERLCDRGLLRYRRSAGRGDRMLVASDVADERHRLFNERVVTDLSTLPPEFVAKVRAKGKALLVERGLMEPES